MAQIRIDNMNIPYMPEKVNISQKANHKKAAICTGEEIVFPSSGALVSIKFSGYFEKDNVYSIEFYKMIRNFIKSAQIISVDISMEASSFSGKMLIESFDSYESGGAVGRIFYDISFLEYRQAVFIKNDKNGALITDTSQNNINNINNQNKANSTNNGITMYSVKKGDTLWKIAKQFLGKSSRYNEIYMLNRDKIKNPSLIYPNTVIKIPKR